MASNNVRFSQKGPPPMVVKIPPAPATVYAHKGPVSPQSSGRSHRSPVRQRGDGSRVQTRRRREPPSRSRSPRHSSGHRRQSRHGSSRRSSSPRSGSASRRSRRRSQSSKSRSRSRSSSPNPRHRPPMCPNDLRCNSINDERHYARYRHTCRRSNCDYKWMGEHRRLFSHAKTASRSPRSSPARGRPKSSPGRSLSPASDGGVSAKGPPPQPSQRLHDEKERGLEREKERELEREKERGLEREKERERERQLEREREREWEREWERERERERERSNEGEKERERERMKQNEMERERAWEEEREQHREKEREWEREKEERMRKSDPANDLDELEALRARTRALEAKMGIGGSSVEYAREEKQRQVEPKVDLAEVDQKIKGRMDGFALMKELENLCMEVRTLRHLVHFRPTLSQQHGHGTVGFQIDHSARRVEAAIRRIGSLQRLLPPDDILHGRADDEVAFARELLTVIDSSDTAHNYLPPDVPRLVHSSVTAPSPIARYIGTPAS